MLPTYPNMTPSSDPYPHLSTRPNPSDTSVCKPVAIISHDSSLTLVTCLQTHRLQDNQFICQHQEHRSNVSSTPRASLIQDLQRQSCCVYTLNPDGTRVQEPLADLEASVAPLTELRSEDLRGLTETGDEQVYNTRQDDLDMHEVNEEEMLQLLPQQALTTPLSFSQQGASTSTSTTFSQAASTSAAALYQGASTSAQALPTLLNQPSGLILLPQETINHLNTLIPSNREKIYCILEVLDNNKGKLLTKKALIETMRARYINFDNALSLGAYHHAFTHAINIGLIQKSGHHSDAEGVVYRLGTYGPPVLEYLKKDIAPKLVHRTAITAHSNDGQ